MSFLAPTMTPPPPPPPPPAPPTLADSSVQAVGANARNAAAAAAGGQGFNNTIATSPQGAPNPQTTGGGKSLTGQ
jgi:hypothetical protein